MNNFESLADSKDRPVNIFLILLLLHVRPDSLSHLVKVRVFTSLHINHGCTSTSKHNAIDRSKQLFEILVIEIPSDGHGPAACVMQEVHICLPRELIKLLESARPHSVSKDVGCGKSYNWLSRLETTIKVKSGVVLVVSL